MALTIEAPNFEKISKETGQFTSDAISLLWLALNDTRDVERRDFRRASESLEPKLKTIDTTANMNDIDTEGASIISFIGTGAHNITGFKAPETGHSRLLFVNVSGSGTKTFIHNATSETANQLVNSTGADTARATNTGLIYGYIASKWREIART